MRWRLRRAVPADAAACGLVATASFAAAYYDGLAIGDMLAHCARHCSAAAFEAWLADDVTIVTLAEHPDTGVPVGYTTLTAPDLPVEPQDRDVELRRIYLMPAGWGSGLGADLLDRAMKDAALIAASRMLLGVYDRNVRACRFYEKNGFARIGTRKFAVGSAWHDDLVYARAI